MTRIRCNGKRFWTAVFLVSLGLFSFAAPLAAADQELRMAVTDVEGLEMLQREFGSFRDMLAKYSGYDVKFFPVPNRTAAVEAVRSKKVDFVLTGPAEYVVFRKLTNSQPIIGFSRPDYYCSVVALADSAISSVEDLRGKKIAIGSVGSTSKHLAPLQILSDNGLDPLKDVKVIHTSVDLGWEALKRGDVAAWGMTTDKFLSLRAKDKDLPPGAFRVIARGPDLPNDVLLAASHVDGRTIDKVIEVFSRHSDELIQAILQGEDNKKYAGMKFLPTVKDSDYNYVRSMYTTIGYPQFDSFL
jgi:phosphonate transport system substrate-binding protein